MNSNEKLVTAAKRAARRLAKRTGTPYQACLDDVAKSAGRRNWGDFLSDPVEIEQEPRSDGGADDVVPLDRINQIYSREDASALEATIVLGTTPGRTADDSVGRTTIRKASYAVVVRIPTPGEGLQSDTLRPESHRMALGTKGVLLQRMVRAGHDAAVVIIGRPKTGKSRNVIGASAIHAPDVNIVIHDPSGSAVRTLGRTWTSARNQVMLDFSESRFKGSSIAFDPFHPTMRWGSIEEMADAICDILFLRYDGKAEYFLDKARGFMREAIVVLDAVPDLIPSDGPARRMTLVGLRDWFATLARDEYEVLKSTIAAAVEAGLPHEHMSSLGDMAARERSAVLGTIDQNILALKNPNAARVLEPHDWEAGGQIGRLLNRIDDRTVVVVRSNPPEAGAFGSLRGIALEWCARLGSAWAGSRRPMHLHLDDAATLPRMPWIRAVAAGEAPGGVTTSMAFLDGRSFARTVGTMVHGRRPVETVLTSQADVETQGFVERHYGRRELEHSVRKLADGRMMRIGEDGSQTLRHLQMTPTD